VVTLNLKLQFTGQYIGNPYWIEMYKVIEITKHSGMSRARSEGNRRKALEEYLRLTGMTFAEYESLEAMSKLPFHTNDDGFITIPSERILSFLVAVCDTVRSAQNHARWIK